MFPAACRIHSVLYRSPRLQALRIRQGHKAATSETAGRALTHASATSSMTSTSASLPPASLRPYSNDARCLHWRRASTQIRPCHYIFFQTIQLPQPDSLPFLIHSRGRSAPPWPMGNDHLSGERCVLSVDCLLPCARDSPLLWVIVPECLILFPYLPQFHWIVLNVSTPKVRKIKRWVVHHYICRVARGVIFTELRHCKYQTIIIIEQN
jgi:hypothetical protein